MALYSKCGTCGARIPFRTGYCNECTVKWKANKNNSRDKDIKRFRSSSAWQKKREQILKDNNYLCCNCRRKGHYIEAKEVHHIIPLSKDFELRLDDNNLIPLCDNCHNGVHTGEISIPPIDTEYF